MNSTQIQTNITPQISLPISDNDHDTSFDLKINHLELNQAQQDALNLSNTYGYWLKIEISSINNEGKKTEVQWASADPLMDKNFKALQD